MGKHAKFGRIFNIEDFQKCGDPKFLCLCPQTHPLY